MAPVRRGLQDFCELAESLAERASRLGWDAMALFGVRRSGPSTIPAAPVFCGRSTAGGSSNCTEIGQYLVTLRGGPAHLAAVRTADHQREERTARCEWAARQLVDSVWSAEDVEPISAVQPDNGSKSKAEAKQDAPIWDELLENPGALRENSRSYPPDHGRPWGDTLETARVRAGPDRGWSLGRMGLRISAGSRSPRTRSRDCSAR